MGQKRKMEQNSERKIQKLINHKQAAKVYKYALAPNVEVNEKRRLCAFLGHFDLDYYRTNNYAAYKYIVLSIYALRAQCENELTDADDIEMYMTSNCNDASRFIKHAPVVCTRLSNADKDWYAYYIKNKYEHIEILRRKKEVLELFEYLSDDIESTTSFTDTAQRIREACADLLHAIEIGEDDSHGVERFDFTDKDAAVMLKKMIEKSRLPSSILQCGIRHLNALLGGGFKPKKLYTVLGASGRFKSGTLLNLAEQIRTCNPQLRTIKPETGKTPIVLYVSVENSIEQTMARLYSMYGDTNYDYEKDSPEEVFRCIDNAMEKDENGEMLIGLQIEFSGNVTKYSTADIMKACEELEKQDKTIIAVVVDYIKPLQSSDKNMNTEERFRLSAVARELKTLSNIYNAPVLSAMQLNRDGNSVMATLLRDGKCDAIKAVSLSNIGNCWDIAEVSDWVCAVNLEPCQRTGENFLTTKILKARDENLSNIINYFVHPFINRNSMKLIQDVHFSEPVSRASMANTLISITEQEKIDAEKYKSPQLSDIVNNQSAYPVDYPTVNQDGTMSQRDYTGFLSGTFIKNESVSDVNNVENNTSEKTLTSKERDELVMTLANAHMENRNVS